MAQRRTHPWSVGLVLAVCLGFAGQKAPVISVKPLAFAAGRILALQQVWRISDEAGGYYFKRPSNLAVTSKGHLFIKDEKQLLHFDPDGRFVKNLYKEGQGPGEISKNFNFSLAGNLLLIRDYGNRRFITLNLDGLFQDRLDEKISRSNPLGMRADGYLVMDYERPPAEEQTGKLMATFQHISMVSRDGKVKKRIHTFSSRWFLAPTGGIQWDADIYTLSDDGRYLVGCHASDYVIEVVDLAAGGRLRVFGRKYSRIKHTPGVLEKEQAQQFNAPIHEYEWAIRDLFAEAGGIWVKTSATDPAKGDLFDVFDYQGRYLDSFYLGIGRTLMNVRGRDVYTLEKTPEETFVIAKYRRLD
jgi:hypothetical protein